MERMHRLAVYAERLGNHAVMLPDTVSHGTVALQVDDPSVSDLGQDHAINRQ